MSRAVGGDYLAAHEAFETIWRSTTPEPREALQALAQVGAALYNALVRGQLRGAARTLTKARYRLEGCRAVELGLDLATLRSDLDDWQVWLDGGGVAVPPPAPRLAVVAPEDLR